MLRQHRDIHDLKEQSAFPDDPDDPYDSPVALHAHAEQGVREPYPDATGSLLPRPAASLTLL